MEKLKSIKKILFDMDNDLTAAECAIVKGKFQSVQLFDDFQQRKQNFKKYITGKVAALCQKFYSIILLKLKRS